MSVFSNLNRKLIFYNINPSNLQIVLLPSKQTSYLSVLFIKVSLHFQSDHRIFPMMLLRFRFNLILLLNKYLIMFIFKLKLEDKYN